ncbi:MAG: hypothetical protein ACP5JG_03035 [Anaerolineae bacterium]
MQVRNVASQPVLVGDTEVVPQSRVWEIRWPFGGWVWHRPVGLIVRRGSEVKRVPIPDVMRQVMVGMAALTLIALAFAWLAVQKQSSERRV